MKKKTSSQPQKKSRFPVVFLTCAVLLSYVGLGYLFYTSAWHYKTINFDLPQDLQKQFNENQQANYQDLQNQIAESKKIYVYSLEEVLRQLNVLETKKKFEEDILKLNDELLEAEKKIETLKDAKVQEDFSDIYLNNLRMKRDDLVNNYEQEITNLTDKINAVLMAIAQEKNIPTIFVHSSIAVNTDYVIDLTNEIAARLQQQQQ